MIGLDGEKMSKSRGNLVLVSRLREAGTDPMAIRLALLSGHYRADREWFASTLTVAEKIQQRLQLDYVHLRGGTVHHRRLAGTGQLRRG